MTPEQLASAIAAHLDADRQAHANQWPENSTVRRDPRVEFLSEELKSPAVRVAVDPDGEVRELAGIGVQMTVKVYVGYAKKVLTTEQYDAAIEWGRRLINVMDVEKLAGCDWSHQRPATWEYQSDPSAITTNKDGTIAGEVVGLFSMAWLGVQA